VLRAAGSFDRGNAPRKLVKGKAQSEDSDEEKPKNVKGPFFAEFDVTAPAAGEYQLDMLEEETGRGTADVWINGVLEKRGLPPVTNREASPDSGGWSVTGVFPLLAGKNVIRLEHKSTFPYFESMLISPLPKGVQAPRTLEQVARQYKINAGFLEQWVEELQRSKGAPHSVLFALLTYVDKQTLSGDALAGWTSPGAVRFRGFQPKSLQELATKYQGLFQEADAQWQEFKKTLPPEPKDKDPDAGNGGKPDPALPDAVMESFHELSYAKAGPFRAPKDAREYYPPPVREQLALLDKEHKALEDSTPDLPKAMGIAEGKIDDLQINIRGSHWTLGEKVPRRFLRVVAGENQPPIPAGQSGRLQLAEWLAKPDHPLTSRVMANRIWRWHFGRGIVPSTDNFGRLGELPTNQPLLDWLALRFVEGGWSIKQLHRTIMLSSAYQMSSNFIEHAAEVDPENTLLWRFNRQRLEAEEIRDAVTEVSGMIDLSVGGTILKYKDRQYVANTSRRGGIDYDVTRRAVYVPVLRSSMYEMFQAFDLPDPSTPNGDRHSTVIAPQALFVMNSTLVLKCTRSMAQALLARTDMDDSARIRDAYERALARPPAARDVDRALTFIAKVEAAMEGQESDPAKRRLFAWQSFCKSLMGSNEFIYVN
jgi:hypothetical protein